jgi:REP element-mobilizing transposase RayT
MPRRTYPTPEAVPTSLSIEHPYKPGTSVPVRRRPVRWEGVDYAAAGCVCFVTYNLKETDTLLVDEVGGTAWRALLDQRDREGFTLHAACLMPDHVHVLVSPTGQGESVSDIVRGIKLSQFHAVKAGHNRYLRWQPSFYDHILRGWHKDRDEFETIAWYIRQNPVRAELVTTWEEYLFVL